MSQQKQQKSGSEQKAHSKKIPSKVSRKKQVHADHHTVLSLMAVSSAKPELKMSEGKEGMMVNLVKAPTQTKEFARTLLGNRPVFTKLIQDVGVTTGAAGGALASAIPADLTLTTGYSSWFNLFDEVRVHDVKSRFIMAFGSAATPDIATTMWASNFDPTQSAAPGSIASVLTASRTLGPMPMHGFTGSNVAITNVCTGLLPVSTQGHWALASGRLTQSILPVNSGGVMGPSPVSGDWVSTSDATIVVGYFKYYGEALGGTSVWTMRSFHEFNCEFRFRG